MEDFKLIAGIILGGGDRLYTRNDYIQFAYIGGEPPILIPIPDYHFKVLQANGKLEGFGQDIGEQVDIINIDFEGAGTTYTFPQDSELYTCYVYLEATSPPLGSALTVNVYDTSRAGNPSILDTLLTIPAGQTKSLPNILTIPNFSAGAVLQISVISVGSEFPGAGVKLILGRKYNEGETFDWERVGLTNTGNGYIALFKRENRYLLFGNSQGDNVSKIFEEIDRAIPGEKVVKAFSLTSESTDDNSKTVSSSSILIDSYTEIGWFEDSTDIGVQFWSGGGAFGVSSFFPEASRLYSTLYNLKPPIPTGAGIPGLTREDIAGASINAIINRNKIGGDVLISETGKLSVSFGNYILVEAPEGIPESNFLDAISNATITEYKYQNSTTFPEEVISYDGAFSAVSVTRPTYTDQHIEEYKSTFSSNFSDVYSQDRSNLLEYTVEKTSPSISFVQPYSTNTYPDYSQKAESREVTITINEYLRYFVYLFNDGPDESGKSYATMPETATGGPVVKVLRYTANDYPDGAPFYNPGHIHKTKNVSENHSKSSKYGITTPWWYGEDVTIFKYQEEDYDEAFDVTESYTETVANNGLSPEGTRTTNRNVTRKASTFYAIKADTNTYQVWNRANETQDYRGSFYLEFWFFDSSNVGSTVSIDINRLYWGPAITAVDVSTTGNQQTLIESPTTFDFSTWNIDSNNIVYTPQVLPTCTLVGNRVDMLWSENGEVKKWSGTITAEDSFTETTNGITFRYFNSCTVTVDSVEPELGETFCMITKTYYGSNPSGWLIPKEDANTLIYYMLNRLHFRNERQGINVYKTTGGGIELSVPEQKPSNNSFGGAVLLEGQDVSVRGNNYGADWQGTLSEPSLSPPTQSVWYKWVAPSSTPVTIHTLGSPVAADYQVDTVIAVYTGSSLDSLSLIASNDNASVELPPNGDYLSAVVINPTEGTTYYIQVDGYSDEQWSFVLSITTEGLNVPTPIQEETRRADIYRFDTQSLKWKRMPNAVSAISPLTGASDFISYHAKPQTETLDGAICPEE